MNTHTTTRILCFAAAISQFASAQQAAQPAQTPAKDGPRPSLVVVEKELNLGKIPSTAKAGFKVHLRNQGGKPVRLLRVSAPCGCTAVAPTMAEIAPGQEIEIPVTFDPHGYFSTTVKQLDFQSNDPARQGFTWHFQADIQSPTIPQPKALGLNLIEGVTPNQEVTFRFVPARTAFKVQSLAFAKEEDLPVLPEVKWNMDHGEVKGTLILSQSAYTPSIAAAERNIQRHARLVLTTTGGDSDWIDVYWRFDGFVWAQPSTINLGEIPVGTTHEGQAFLAWRLPLKNVKVVKVSTSSPDLTAEVSPYNLNTQAIRFAWHGSKPSRFMERIMLDIEADDTSTTINAAPAKVHRLVYVNVSGIVSPIKPPTPGQ